MEIVSSNCGPVLRAFINFKQKIQGTEKCNNMYKDHNTTVAIDANSFEQLRPSSGS